MENWRNVRRFGDVYFLYRPNSIDTRLETRFACASTPCRESRSSVATERLVFRVVTAAI